MQIHTIMTTPVQALNRENTLDSAARLMRDRSVGCVPVVSTDDKLVGILTDRDIVMAVALGERPLPTLRIADAMHTPVHTCRASDNIEEAARIMSKHRVRRLPVVDATESLVGLVSIDDLAYASRQPTPTSDTTLTADELGELYHATSGRSKHPHDSQDAWMHRSGQR
jgi:CBS domain-containing protein